MHKSESAATGSRSFLATVLLAAGRLSLQLEREDDFKNMVSFQRPTGAAADLSELEYVSALQELHPAGAKGRIDSGC